MARLLRPERLASKLLKLSIPAFAELDGSRVVWTADFLPDEAESFLDSMIEQGIQVMKKTLDSV